MKNIYRIIVTGSKKFDHYATLARVLDNYITTLPMSAKITIVCGACRETDILAERYAYEHDFEIRKFFLDRKSYGNAALYERNQKMVNYAGQKNITGVLFAFCDGSRSGTKDIIKRAKNNDLNVYIKYI